MVHFSVNNVLCNVISRNFSMQFHFLTFFISETFEILHGGYLVILSTGEISNHFFWVPIWLVYRPGHWGRIFSKVVWNYFSFHFRKSSAQMLGDREFFKNLRKPTSFSGVGSLPTKNYVGLSSCWKVQFGQIFW